MEHILTDHQRRELAGRARTLHERLDGPPNDAGSDLFTPIHVMESICEFIYP